MNFKEFIAFSKKNTYTKNQKYFKKESVFTLPLFFEKNHYK